MTPEVSLIEYPSAFPIKVMGLHVDIFVDSIVTLVLEHAPGFDPSTLEHRPSSSGKYLGLTITVTATTATATNTTTHTTTTARRTVGAAGCTRRTTRTSARCTCCSRSPC